MGMSLGVPLFELIPVRVAEGPLPAADTASMREGDLRGRNDYVSFTQGQG